MMMVWLPVKNSFGQHNIVWTRLRVAVKISSGVTHLSALLNCSDVAHHPRPPPPPPPDVKVSR